MDGHITYTVGAGGTWIAWRTERKPAANATGRDLAACPGAVHFAIGATAEAAFAALQADAAAAPSARAAT